MFGKNVRSGKVTHKLETRQSRVQVQNLTIVPTTLPHQKHISETLSLFKLVWYFSFSCSVAAAGMRLVMSLLAMARMECRDSESCLTHYSLSPIASLTVW